MKLKKGLIALFISILILTVGTNSFAVSSKKEKSNVIKNEILNETNENKTKSKNETKNKTKNETKNTVKNETKDNKKDEKKSTSNKASTKKKTSKIETINKDVVSGNIDESVTYKDIVVNGNMFLANSDKVTINNVKVDGDVVIFADKVEIKDSRISGNVYTTTSEIIVSNSEIISMYSVADKIKVLDETEITRELRCVGSNVTINAEIGRDAYIVAEEVKIEDDSVITGKAFIRASSKSISDDADVEDLDYEKIESYKVYPMDVNHKSDITAYLLGKGTEIIIILVIALFMLCALPKFTEVNSSLRLRDFVKAFFTGLLEFIVIIAIAIVLFCTGYGAGYGFILLSLLLSFVALGKTIFIISFAIRMSCNPEKISKIRALLATLLVALVLFVIEMITLAGIVGIIIDFVINMILALTGLGTIIKILFTSKRRLSILSQTKLEGKQGNVEEIVVEEVVNTEPEKVEEKSQEVNNEDIKAEIKAEIKEEIKELKEEREEEKKQENDASVTDNNKQETKEEVNEESKNENKEEVKENKNSKKEKEEKKDKKDKKD